MSKIPSGILSQEEAGSAFNADLELAQIQIREVNKKYLDLLHDYNGMR